jgi:flagellar protein FliJ
LAFKFRYEALLGFRLHQKEKAEVEFARAKQLLRQMKETMKEYHDDMQATRMEMAQTIREKTDSDTVRNYSQYLGALKIWIAMLEAEIVKAEKIVAEKLEDLLSRTKKYKIIEKLKEKDYQKWKNKLNIMEQKEISESGVLRHGRTFL